MSTLQKSETRVQLKGVHLCCGGCTGAVDEAVASVPGASSVCDMDNGTVTVTAQDQETAQQALDAIARAGFHGETGDPGLAMKADPNLPSGKVQRLTVSNIHNCCDLCYDAIKGAIDSVEGVTSDTGGPEETNFEVIGHFSAAELLQALHGAGFHAKLRA